MMMKRSATSPECSLDALNPSAKSGFGARWQTWQNWRLNWRSHLQGVLDGWLGNAPAVPQLRVWHHSDRHGQLSWSGYDPVTGRSIHRVSEDEIRTWIEQRYRLSPSTETVNREALSNLRG